MSAVVHLDCVFLAAVEVRGFPRGTVAVAIVTDSYGTAQEAGGTAEVAGARISDVVIAADWLLRWHGNWARCSATHDTVGTVGLVGHTGVSPWTHDIGA